MKPMRGEYSNNQNNFDEGDEDGDWDNNGSEQNFGNFRNQRYNNAYGNYQGGYGPMNSGGFRPMNDGGYGRMNNYNFGPLNPDFGPPQYMGLPENFGPGPRPLFPGEPPMMGRGFGFRGPNKSRRANDKIFKFLLSCGLARDQLKKLPASLMELMDQEYCGLCAHSFSSFALAKIHYVSKNHLKNQKKWLSQHSEAGYQQSREVPLKSRELYCELCDVHITSKSHSESHYAGKPHRAIVEGRKMPRNPLLLQRGMAGRMALLIRREKRNLKFAVEDVGDKEEKEVDPRDVKPYQPELYCNICKTSVTCSDQMTMHLNGKRHLTKEKQHILKMMKGETTDDGVKQKKRAPVECVNRENPEAKEGDDEEEGNDDDKEADDDDGDDGDDGDEADSQADEKAAEADDNDWGNGGGTWDEPETI